MLPGATAQGHSNLVRLLLLQRPLTRILLALCDISSAYEAVTEGMFVYRNVTMLLMLRGAFNPWIHGHQSINNIYYVTSWGSSRQHIHFSELMQSKVASTCKALPEESTTALHTVPNAAHGRTMIDEANMDIVAVTAIMCKVLCQHKQRVTWRHVLQVACNH